MPSGTQSDSAVFPKLREVIAPIAHVSEHEIELDTSVVEELNFDSLRLLDLTFAIEASLGISEFPMQRWYDVEASRTDRRFTVRSLALVCEACVANQNLSA